MLRPAAVLLAAFTVLTGLFYPAAVTGIAQALFPAQANGSLLRAGDRIVGSELIGQPFSSARYFWSRPSATAPSPYNGEASMGSNQGPTNPALQEAVAARVAALRAADPGNPDPIPADLVTASASGLDPHLSPAAAYYQVRRVARARGQSEARIRDMVAHHVEDRTFGVLGEPRVNVLRLNMELDRLVATGRGF